MGAYNAALNFLKGYVAEFCRCDYELAHLFGTANFLAKIEITLPESNLLAKGPIDEPVLGFVYKPKKSSKKDFFWVLDKHLVPTKALQKFISRSSNSDAPDQVKEKFVSQLQWYIEVQDWLLLSSLRMRLFEPESEP